tara:strand:+ start:736 stop:1188 length:453 start_codon:yes stop_codon:yes gene_type:complete
MSEADRVEKLPCEKCGEPTPFDMLATVNTCEHCGTPEPHANSSIPDVDSFAYKFKALGPFLLLFGGAFIFYGINPFHWGEERMFVTLFGIFCLMFFFLGVLPFYLALRKIKKASREKVESEGIGAKLTEEEEVAAAWDKKTRTRNPKTDE